MNTKTKTIRINKHKLSLHNKKFRELLKRNMITYKMKMLKISPYELSRANGSSFWNENFGEQSVKKHNEKIRRASIKITRFERWKQLRE